MALVIRPEHGYVVLSTAAICLYTTLAGFLYVSRSRNKVFSKEWAESEGVKSLEEEHKKATGSVKLPKDGYPDMGNGRFAATLPYADWLSFNNAQRAHYNLLEIFPSALGLHVLSGIFYPVPTAASAVLWIAARHSWSSNYATYGSEKRYSGILPATHFLCMLGWLGASIYGGARMAQLLK